MNFGEIQEKYNVVISDIGLGTFVVEPDEMAVELGLDFDVEGAKEELKKFDCGNITIR